MGLAGSDVAAIVLAGGRSSRLGGTPKAALVLDGQTLLERTLAALPDARHIVIVADEQLVRLAAPAALDEGFGRISVTRERPPFGGPAAAIAAGADALAAAGVEADLVVVVACDMPNVGVAVRVLLAATTAADALGVVQQVGGVAPAEGFMAVDAEGRAQFLTAVYRSDALASAVSAASQEGSLENLSARALFAPLSVARLPVPDGSTHDIDTAADAAAFGIDLENGRTP